jgi:hypothetical protein
MVAALGLVVTVVTPCDGLAFQAQTVVVKIQPPSLVVEETGGNFSVEVVVENTSELGAFEFVVRFDPMVTLFVDVQVERFLGSTGRNVICEPPILTESTVGFGCHTDGLTNGPSGSGPLALLTFSAHVAGVSPLALLDCELSNTLGGQIPATCESGEVTNPVSHFCPIELPGLPDIRIEPESQQISVGRDFTVNVEVVDTSELGDFEFTLLYDPAIVSLVDVQVERFLGSTGRNVICEPPILTERTVRFGCHTGGLTPTGPSGSGPLALLTFSANGAGASPLALISCELSTILGDPVPANCKCGSVDVREAPPPGVGGTVKLPPAAVAAESGALAGDSGWATAAYAALAGSTIAVASAAWYTRRRWLR